MAHCPRCAKKFNSRMAVLAHMNQPLGSCMSYIAELASLHLPSSMVESPVASGNESDLEVQDCGIDAEATVWHEGETSDDTAMAVDSPLASKCRPDNVKEFQGAGCTFGKGKTFLEDFNTDPHAAEREVNLYYPFASKEEWELGSFLLLSGLSMANISGFLSLKLVSSFALLRCPAQELIREYLLGAVALPLFLHC